MKDFPGEAKDHRRDDDQEENADETIAFEDCERRAGNGADDIADSHRNCVAIKNVVSGREVGHGGEIGGEVDDLGVGAGVKKIESEHADKNKNQKTAGARAEKAVVEPNDDSSEYRQQPRLIWRETRRVEIAEIFFGKGVSGDRNHQDKNNRFERFAADVRHRARAEEREDQGGDGGGKNERPMELNAARVIDDRHAGPAERGEFIGAPNGSKRPARFGGKENEERGQLDEAAAAHDGVDEAGEECEETEIGGFHWRFLNLRASEGKGFLHPVVQAENCGALFVSGTLGCVLGQTKGAGRERSGRRQIRF
jgi:hypothetical protein